MIFLFFKLVYNNGDLFGVFIIVIMDDFKNVEFVFSLGRVMYDVSFVAFTRGFLIWCWLCMNMLYVLSLGNVLFVDY